MRKIIPLLFALLIPCCYAQTNMGPINTPQVNSTLYVGSLSGSQFYPTIQSAVTSACASGANRVVDIPPAYTGVDPISGVTGGCTNTTLRDEHAGLPVACYTWQTSVYSSSGASCANSTGRGNAYALSVVGPQNNIPGNNVFPGLTYLPDGNIFATYLADSGADSNVTFDGGMTWNQKTALWSPPGGEAYQYLHPATLENGQVALDGGFGNSSGAMPFFSLGTISNPVVTYAVGAPSVAPAIDSAGNTVVANYNANTVQVISPTGTVLHTITGLSQPTFVTVVPTGVTGAGNIWIANSGNNTVTVLNSSYTAISGSPFSVGVAPVYIAIAASGNAWIADRGPIGSGGTATATLSGGSTGTVTGYTATAAGSYAVAPVVIFSGTANLAGNLVPQTISCLGTLSSTSLVNGSCSSSVSFTNVPTATVVGQGEVTELTYAGVNVSGSPYTWGAYALNAITVLPSTNVWVGYGSLADQVSGIAVLNSSGVYQSDLPYSSNRANAFATDTSGNICEVGLGGTVVCWTNTGTLLSQFNTTPAGDTTGISIDSNDDYWISKLTLGTVNKYTSTGATLGQIAVGALPEFTTIDASGYLWISSLGTNNIYKVNTTVPIDSITFSSPTTINIAGQTLCYASGPVVQTGTTNLAMPVWCAANAGADPYPLESGLITSTNLGTSWGAFTVVGSSTNDPVQPSLGYDEASLLYYPATGDLGWFGRHEDYASGGDPYGTYAWSLLKSGSTTWPVPQDVITGCGYGTMLSYVGEPSVTLGPQGQTVLAGRCQVPGQTAQLDWNAKTHSGAMSLNEGARFSPMVLLAPTTDFDDAYEALATSPTGAIGELQASSGVLNFVTLTPFGVSIPNGINTSIAQPYVGDIAPTSIAATGPISTYFPAGTGATPTPTISSTNSTLGATFNCNFHGFASGYALTGFCAHRASPLTSAATDLEFFGKTGNAANALIGTLDHIGNWTPQNDYYDEAGYIVIPHSHGLLRQFDRLTAALLWHTDSG